MSNPIPAIDEQIAALNADLRRREDEHYFFEASVSLGLSLIARIESDRATIAEQAKRIRVLEAQNLTYRLADNPATVEAFQSEMEEAEATIADLRDEAERSERLVADILASARREREDLRAEVRRLEDGVLSEASSQDACPGLKAMARGILARREGRG